MKRHFGAMLVAVMAFGSAAMAADLVDAARITAFDFQAQRDNGTNSNHQSKDAAAFACANWEAVNPGRQCEVQGGRWRVDLNLPTPPVLPPPVIPPPTTPSTWIKCADEGGTCTLPTAGNVRYGAGTTRVTKAFPAGPLLCGNSSFVSVKPPDGDPIAGQVKDCERETGTTAPPTTPAVGTASLSWDPPTQWSDGTPITVPLTYRVEYGIGNFATRVPVNGLVYSVTGLGPGLWQFRVYALTGAVVSDSSNVVTKVIP